MIAKHALQITGFMVVIQSVIVLAIMGMIDNNQAFTQITSNSAIISTTKEM